MIMLWVSVGIVSVVAPGLVFFAIRGNAVRIRTAEDIIGRIQPLDLVAFLNLVDAAEEDYLRNNLPAAAFRVVHRARLLAASAYVHTVASNAALLLRLGDAARQSSDAPIVEAGRVLAASALRLRISAMAALVQIYAGMVLPGRNVSLGAIAESYRELTGSVTRLGRMQQPERTSAIYSVL